MAENENNLNLINNQNQDFSMIKLSQINKEAVFQVPTEQITSFFNNEIQNIINKHEQMLSSNNQKVYSLAMEKTTEMMQGLTKLLLEAFNNVNGNLNVLNSKIAEIDNNYIKLQENCGNMWNKQEKIEKHNESLANSLENSANKLNECINFCNSSNNKCKENNINLAGKLEEINSKVASLIKNNESQKIENKNKNEDLSKEIIDSKKKMNALNKKNEEIEKNIEQIKNTKQIENN